MITSNGILYIEPGSPASAVPVIDTYTRKMTAALRQGVPSGCWRGWHTCRCGARSSNCDYQLPGGEMTNSLCVHYLAHHRGDVSGGQLTKVAALACGEAEPTPAELARVGTG